jgi:hypothetical protein
MENAVYLIPALYTRPLVADARLNLFATIDSPWIGRFPAGKEFLKKKLAQLRNSRHTSHPCGDRSA